ncbi:MAG: tyrosine recombinase XerC [Clostridia bacterium]|nr:tyrosine recombinase XerC [Clostridia bacterium]
MADFKNNGIVDEYAEYPMLIKEFIRYSSVVKGKSKLSIDGYALDLKLFFRFLLFRRNLVARDVKFDDIDITGVDLDFIKTVSLYDAYDFLAYCKDVRGNDTKARARKTTSIRTFFNYLTLKAHKLEFNPMVELETPKIRKSLPKYLTLDQSVELLESVDGNNRERDYCIITLFLNCGLRLSELVGLNLSDFFDNNTMRVLGKGNKERTIYLNSACVSAINDYLAVRCRDDDVKDKNALFLSRFKKRISPKTVQHIVNTFLEKAGLGGRGLSTHKLRHTAATLMYQHGKVDVLVLKDILGHENVGTTEIYTHILKDQLKSAVDSNPLSIVKKSRKKKDDTED